MGRVVLIIFISIESLAKHPIKKLDDIQILVLQIYCSLICDYLLYFKIYILKSILNLFAFFKEMNYWLSVKRNKSLIIISN